MADLLPLVALGWHRDLGIFGAVDDDILGLDAAFELAHLGMLPATAEETRWLDLEVANLLLVAINDADPVLLGDGLVLVFQGLRDTTQTRNRSVIKWKCQGETRSPKGR